MDTSSDNKLNPDILEFLLDYPQLRLQYLFFNCFVISSKEDKSIYDRAKRNHINNLKKVEVYFTPNYLYDINKKASIFKKINQQINKKFYYLKEHIFYYQYLLRCLKAKNEKEDKHVIDGSFINEIEYRILMNRLYLLYDGSDSNVNYGITKIFGIPSIYTIVEPNIINQIINMKKFDFEKMKMDKNKVLELFGINEDIDEQSFLYNNLLISISEGNSSIIETNNRTNDTNDDINHIHKGAIVVEKNLIDLSSELFLFNYITKQFDKKYLIQIPRIIFFCGIYDDKYKNIYEIQIEKEKEKNSLTITTEEEMKKNEGKEEIIDKTKSQFNYSEKEIKTKKIEVNNINIGKEIEIKGLNLIKNEGKEETLDQRINKTEVDNKTIIKNNFQLNLKIDESQIKEKKEQKKSKNIYKNLLKCELISFCGTLEIDGAFKYIGENLEIKGESLVIIISEYLNYTNNIKEYTEKYEAKDIIHKIKKYYNKDNPKLFQSKIKNYKSIEINVMNDNIDNIMENLNKISERVIISDKKKIIVNQNDIVLIENKREYPNHISDEIRNFIEHSFYFINLYKNLNLLDENNIIHLLFVYDHYRNYYDESEAFSELYKITKENKAKLNVFSNKIKFYLVHSLPNLNLSIFDRLENEISDLKGVISNLNGEISNLNGEITNLKEEKKNLSVILNEFKKQNKKLEHIENYMNTINDLKKQIYELNDKLKKMENANK